MCFKTICISFLWSLFIFIVHFSSFVGIFLIDLWNFFNYSLISFIKPLCAPLAAYFVPMCHLCIIVSLWCGFCLYFLLAEICFLNVFEFINCFCYSLWIWVIIRKDFSILNVQEILSHCFDANTSIDLIFTFNL